MYQVSAMIYHTRYTIRLHGKGINAGNATPAYWEIYTNIRVNKTELYRVINSHYTYLHLYINTLHDDDLKSPNTYNTHTSFTFSHCFTVYVFLILKPRALCRSDAVSIERHLKRNIALEPSAGAWSPAKREPPSPWRAQFSGIICDRRDVNGNYNRLVSSLYKFTLEIANFWKLWKRFIISFGLAGVIIGGWRMKGRNFW